MGSTFSNTHFTSKEKVNGYINGYRMNMMVDKYKIHITKSMTKKES
jgi:hypothetical protein